MKYSELLSRYIEESGLSLGEIAIKLANRNIKVDRSYISKLKNGNKSPASDEVTKALAEVTGGDPEALLLAGYIEKAPEEIKSLLTEATNTGELFSFFGLLVTYLEHYRSTGSIDEELLRKIDITNKVFAQDYNYRLATSPLKDYPEYAVELIARLKQHFIPLADSISYRGAKIDFSHYIRNGRPVFKENPYPEMVNDAEEAETLRREAIPVEVIPEETNMSFFGGPEQYTEDEIEEMEAALRRYREMKKRAKEQAEKEKE